MTPAATASPAHRAEAVEAVARHLLPRASLITRLLLRRGSTGLSRAETGILSSLEQGPQRITELAASQALAQPTVTQLVALLDTRGLVARGRHPGDGRVVLVSLTDDGRAALDAFRAHYRAVLRDQLADRSDAEVLALAAATEVLQDVIDALQGEAGR
ncbi:MAG TPA: MarR family transcriptional regulator [Baekduia sp.]